MLISQPSEVKIIHLSRFSSRSTSPASSECSANVQNFRRILEQTQRDALEAKNMIEELKKSDKTRRRSRKEAKENSKAKEIVGKSDLEKPEKTSPKKMSDNPVKTNENSKVTDKQPKINEVLQSKNASTQNNNKNNNKEITVSFMECALD